MGPLVRDDERADRLVSVKGRSMQYGPDAAAGEVVPADLMEGRGLDIVGGDRALALHSLAEFGASAERSPFGDEVATLPTIPDVVGPEETSGILQLRHRRGVRAERLGGHFGQGLEPLLERLVGQQGLTRDFDQRVVLDADLPLFCLGDPADRQQMQKYAGQDGEDGKPHHPARDDLQQGLAHLRSQ